MSDQPHVSSEDLSKIRREWNIAYAEGKVIHALIDEIERLRSARGDDQTYVNTGKAYCAQCGSFKLVPFNL
jgi:hypothetical protein